MKDRKPGLYEIAAKIAEFCNSLDMEEKIKKEGQNVHLERGLEVQNSKRQPN